jgi:hypothetical protein
VQANRTAQATAARRADLERNLQKLPPFLTQLTPTMRQLGALSDQATPVLADLGARAGDINRLIQALGPFSQSAIPAFQTLGNAAQVGTPAVIRFRPIAAQLNTFAALAKPVGANLAALTSSLQSTGGIERLMDYAFYQTTAINGFDSIGHYLRAALIVNNCAVYKTTPDPNCSANFPRGTSKASSASAASATQGVAADDPVMQRIAAVLAGSSPAAALRRWPTPAPSAATHAQPGRHGATRRHGATSGTGTGASGRRTAVSPQVAVPAPPAAAPGANDPQAGLFNYLLGSGQ